MSWGCVKIAGRKNSTPRLCGRLDRTGDRGASSRAPAMETIRLRIRWNASTIGLAVRPAYGSAAAEASDEDDGEGGRTLKGRWRTGTSVSMGELLSLLPAGDGGCVGEPGHPPRCKCNRPVRCDQRWKRTSYPLIPLKLYLRCRVGSLTTPIIRTASPTHINTLPHVPRNPMNAASSACQLLP